MGSRDRLGFVRTPTLDGWLRPSLKPSPAPAVSTSVATQGQSPDKTLIDRANRLRQIGKDPIKVIPFEEAQFIAYNIVSTYSKRMTAENNNINKVQLKSSAPNTRPGGVASMQEELTSEIKKLCRRLDIPVKNSGAAVRLILGDKYKPTVSLPNEAPATWRGRSGEDENLTPVEFQDKYWGQYIESGALTQSDLRIKDITLFDAINTYCRNRGLNPKEFLPPPSRTRCARRRSPQP